jgi:murein DD-endopeptidase MepM/ murein hydrolase activator NlpD
VNPRKQFSVLILRGDGARVFRVNFPRRLPVVCGVAVTAASLLVGAVVTDWWHLRQRMLDSGSLLRQIDEQHSMIESFKRRVGELRQEVAGWRDMHTRIWEAFGPETAPRGRASGIGGRATPPERVMAATALSPTDELDRLVSTVKEEGDSLRALDRLVQRARRALASLPSRWPVRGNVNSEFGTRLSPWSKAPEFHGGLDIAADRGTLVRAPARGTVAHAGPHGEYGIAVILDHGQDIRTIYGHLSRVHVKAGQVVERGTEVALTGNTGRSSGPHLHYEILVAGKSVNPRTYLWD